MAKKLNPVQCTGKVRFETFAMAQQVAGRKTRRHALRARVYYCRLCDGYHIGNNNKPNRRHYGTAIQQGS